MLRFTLEDLFSSALMGDVGRIRLSIITRGSRIRILLPLVMILSLILPTSPIKAEENKSSSVNLSILATTDVHANMMDYDYYSDKPTTEFGLARTAQLIEKHSSVFGFSRLCFSIS